MDSLRFLRDRLVVIVIGLALVVTGCATGARKPRLQPRSFNTIAIVSPAEFIRYIGPETASDKAIQGMSVGSGTVGLGAMAVGALACGPFLYGLCISGLALTGMAVGGVGGLVYGVTGISSDDAVVLDNKMRELDAGHDLQTELVQELRQQLPEAMLAPVEEAGVQAIVSITSLEFRRSDEDVYLKVTARFAYASDRDTDEENEDGGYREIQGRSERHPLEIWLDADIAQIESAMSQCREMITGDMAGLLLEYWQGE